MEARRIEALRRRTRDPEVIDLCDYALNCKYELKISDAIGKPVSDAGRKEIAQMIAQTRRGRPRKSGAVSKRTQYRRQKEARG